MSKFFKYSLFLFIPLFLVSCKKEEEDLSIPEIEFKSITSTQVIEFDEIVSITISYKDSEGDLGQEDPDNNSLRVKDSRLDNPDWYHIPPITPNNQALITEGEFSIDLAPLFILGNGSEEPVTFSVQLKDRKGNWSNTITVPEVLIVAE